MQRKNKPTMFYRLYLRVIAIIVLAGLSTAGLIINQKAQEAKIHALAVEGNNEVVDVVMSSGSGDSATEQGIAVTKNPLNKSESIDGDGQYKDIPSGWDGPISEDSSSTDLPGVNLITDSNPERVAKERIVSPSLKRVPNRSDDYFGMFSPNILAGGAIDKIQQDVDYKLDLFGTYINWNQSLASNTVQEVCKRGAVPVITWQSWNGRSSWNGGQDYPLKTIAAGAYDGIVVDNFVQLLNKCSGNVIIRFNHEMSIVPGKYGWYPWQGDPESYKAAWRHVVETVDGLEGSERIYWHWNPDQASSYADLYYPGDEYVDYVGVTLNHHKSGGTWTKFEWMYGASKEMLEKHNKPVLIAETASIEEETDPAKKAAWASDAIAYMKKNENIVGMIWFSIDVSSDGKQRDYRYSSTATTVEYMKAALRP